MCSRQAMPRTRGLCARPARSGMRRDAADDEVGDGRDYCVAGGDGKRLPGLMTSRALSAR